MNKKVLIGIAGGLMVAVAMVIASPSTSNTSFAWTINSTNPAQGFNPDYQTCIGAVASNPNAPLVACTGAEDLLLGRSPNIQVSSRIPGGTRQSLAFSYLGPGWRFAKEAAGSTCANGGGAGAVLSLPGTCVAPALGPLRGGIKSTIDLYCDGGVDVFSDAASTGNSLSDPLNDDVKFIPEQSTIQTKTFTTTSGIAGQTDETYLDKLIPTEASAIAPRNFRLRAMADTIRVIGSPAAIDPAAPINFVNMSPSWSPLTQLNATFLGGQVSSPGIAKNCLDTPQNAIVNTTGAGACAVTCTAVGANPRRAAAGAGADADTNLVDDATGYYERWVVNITAPDILNGEIQAAIIENCKYVSADFPAGTAMVAAPAGSDSDADCLEDSTTAEPGRPVDPDDTDADIDDDGIGDGVEVAWGSCPNATYSFTVAKDGFLFDCATGIIGGSSTDTDGDDRSDLEELLANGTNLSNPRNPDTDGDVAVSKDGAVARPIIADFTGCAAPANCNDGGIAWDANDDGSPDAVLAAGTSQTLAGSGSTIGPKTYKAFWIPGTVVRPFEGDNCANISNTAQTNSDSVGITAWTSTTLNGNGTPLDKSNPDEDSTGDACDGDSDNDGMNDQAELKNNWVTLFPSRSCSVEVEGGNAPSITTVGKRDSDNDGGLDGEECQNGTNPTGGCGPTLPCVGAVVKGTYASLPLEAADCGGANIQDPCISPNDDALGIKSERISRATEINQAEGAISCGAGRICDFDGTGNVVANAKYTAVNGTLAGDVSLGQSDPDADADGIGDSLEAFVHGTSPGSQDSDGDFCPDGVEIISVTAPDNKVEFNDFTALTALWNKSRASAGPTYEPLLDFNGSGKIEFGDFSMMTDMWNKSCPAGNILEP